VTTRPDLYFSADIEADGPLPGRWSMLSLGIAVVGISATDGTFTRRDPTASTFYRELQPISDEFVQSALDSIGMDRDRLVKEGIAPSVAMTDARAWVLQEAAAVDARPVLVGWPVVFDWMFLHWYWTTFCPDGDPFRFSTLDIKTLAWERVGRPLDEISMELLPPEVRTDFPHTHNALDDAIEQGQLFANLFEWNKEGHL
jgi:hypothetical protein